MAAAGVRFKALILLLIIAYYPGINVRLGAQALSLKDGLVAYYQFLGSPNDASGNGNHGLVHGLKPPVPDTDRFGMSNGAYRFFGDGAIRIPDQLIQTKAYTLSAWFKRGGGGINSILMMLGEGNPRTASLWSYALGGGGFGSQGYLPEESQGWNVPTPFSGGVGEWHHLLFTIDASARYRLYFDGSLAVQGSRDSADYKLGDSHTRSSIGAYENDYFPTLRSEDSFAGLIDDVRLYNRSLSDDEVRGLYAFESKPPAEDPRVAITVQPKGQTVGVGETVSFGVTATGLAPMSYQWSKDGTALPGATNATLTFTDVQGPRIGDYQVVVSNGAGSVTSSVASLNIQGVDAGIWKGLVAYYPLDGSLNDQSGYGNTAIAQGMPYNTNRFGWVNSALQMDSQSPAVKIAQSESLRVAYGMGYSVSAWIKPATLNSSGCVIEWGEGIGPHLYVNEGGNGRILWAQGGAPNLAPLSQKIGDVGRFVHIVGICDRFNKIVRLYMDGVLIDSFSYVANLAPYDVPPTLTDYPLVIGQRAGSYRFVGLVDDIRIYNRALSDAQVAALYASEAPQSPTIAIQPANRTLGVGETVSFGVMAAGAAPLKYQWSKDGTVLPGATNATLTFTNVQAPRIGDYRVVVSNGAGSVTSSVAALNIQGVEAGIWKGLVAYYPFNDNANDIGPLGLHGVKNGVIASNDRFGLPSKSYTFYSGSRSHIQIPWNKNLSQGMTCLSFWFKSEKYDGKARFIISGEVEFDWSVHLSSGLNPNGIRFIPSLYVIDDSLDVFEAGVWSHLVCISGTAEDSRGIWLNGRKLSSKNTVGDANAPSVHSSSNLWLGGRQMQSGNIDWYFDGQIDDVRIYNRALTSAEVTALYAYESTPPVPTVVTAPVDQTLVAGQTLSLTAQISGSNLSYRWQKDGADLADGGLVSGASTSTLTIKGVTPADAGQYRLTASNANGNAATAAATVSVRVPPAITQQPRSVDGIEGNAVTIGVSATGVPTPTFQWFKNGQALEGQTAATLEFPALKESDAGTYRVVVSNPAGSVTSTDAVLTYTPAIRVLVDGVPVREVVRSLLPVTVDLQFARDGWLVFYTLDGSEPTFASEAFLTPFVIGQTAILKTVAYSADFTQSVAGAPVAFRFLQPQTISWEVVPTLQYQQQGTVGVSASSGLPVVLSVVSGPATVSGNQLTATGVGDVVLRAVQSGSDAFASVTSERTLTVTKAQQALTWPTLTPRTFGDAAFPVVVTASSGLPVTLVVTSGKATVTGTSVTLTGAGPVTLTASQSGDANRVAVSESKTFAVAKAEQTLTFPTVANRAYTPEPFAPAGTSSSGLALAFEVLSGPATVDSGKIRLTGVGSVVLRATQPGSADYNAAVPVDRTFTVSQGTQTLTFTPVGAKTFGDVPVTLSATSSAGLAVTFRVLSGPGTVSGNVLTFSGAGTLVVQALQAGTDLYASASASQNVVVAKAAQTLTFAVLSDTGYTTSALPLVASASSGLPVTFRVVSGPATVSGSELRLTGVGAVSVSADQAGTGNYLAATSVTRSFTVSRGTQEITFTPIGDQVLGNPPVALSATSSSGLPVAFQVISGPATVSGSQLTLLNEGAVVVRARQVGSPLWLPAQVDQTFQIRKLTTLTLSAVTGGTIAVDPVKAQYDPKDIVTLSAVPAEGYRFEGWTGDLTGTANPTTLAMSANRTLGATFKDIAAPVLTWDLPMAGTTGNEQAALSGRVTDNAPGVTATWRRDGGAAQALPLAADGSFRVEGLKLAPGANTFAVSAKDLAGTVTTLERIVTWVPERMLRVANASEVQEGQRLVFPVQLEADAANVAGLTFRLNYDPAYLADPQVEWGALVGQSVNNVNVGTAGQISGSFALAGTALPAGTNPVATVSFRARSVPAVLVAFLTPRIESLSSPSGAALSTGNAVESGEGRILPRKIKGDNNANQRIDVGDAVVISRLQVGLEEVRPWDVALNDLNETKTIDSGDVVKALRFVVGLDAQPKAMPRVGGELSEDRSAVAVGQEGVGPVVEWALSRPLPQSTAPPTPAGLRPAGEAGAGLSEAGLTQLSALNSQPTRSLRPAGSNTNDVATLEFPDGPVAQVGKPYRVVVKLTRAGAAIAGLSFTVNFPSALTLTDKQVGALVPSDALPLWAESAGSVNLAAVRSTVWPTSTGVAAVLTFLPTAAINSQALWPIELVKGEVTGAGFDIRALDNVTGQIRSTSTPPTEPKVVVPNLPTEGGPLALDVEAAAGAAIVLETTTDLGSWSEAQRLTGQGAGKPVRVTVTPDPNARVRFWRVRVP